MVQTRKSTSMIYWETEQNERGRSTGSVRTVTSHASSITMRNHATEENRRVLLRIYKSKSTASVRERRKAMNILRREIENTC